MIETGRQDGTRSKINKLWGHIDRLSSHLFSPTDLHFTIDFENHYPKNILERGAICAKILTRDWERTNTDMLFGQGVFEALRYGSCFLKQWVQEEGEEKTPVYNAALVMPWNFGVTNERNNSLAMQDAMCETITLTLPEVWRRIYHLPNAEKLFQRIKSNAVRGQAGDEQNSFFHQLLSTATLNTGVQGMTRPVPGGIVQLNNDPNYAIVGPELGVDVVKMHELWVRDINDYKCIQIIEPDIMIAPGPGYNASNLLISGKTYSGLQPYTRICANDVTGYMWGRTEVADLIEPQGLLSTWADDTTRLFGLQVDRILAFSGYDGLQDEAYDQQRAAGYFSMEQGATVNDLTPPFPPEALQMLNLAKSTIDEVGGFDNIMNAQAQPGVRSAEHGELLKQMASPRLRDRSLLVERQCATAADLRLSLREAKDGHNYWTDGTSEEAMGKTRFLMNDLPDDRRVSVDSHSSSPVFKDSHQQTIAFLAKANIIDGESVLENLDLPNRDILIQRFREKEKQQQMMLQQLIQRDPEAAEKLLTKGKHK